MKVTPCCPPAIRNNSDTAAEQYGNSSLEKEKKNCETNTAQRPAAAGLTSHGSTYFPMRRRPPPSAIVVIVTERAFASDSQPDNKRSKSRQFVVCHAHFRHPPNCAKIYGPAIFIVRQPASPTQQRGEGTIFCTGACCGQLPGRITNWRARTNYCNL